MLELEGIGETHAIETASQQHCCDVRAVN